MNVTTGSFRIFAACFLIVLLAGAAHVRNRVWSTKLSLWSDAARKSPMKSRSHNNLGNCYMLLERPFEAIEQYRIAVALDSRNIEAYYNLAMNLESVGILNQAVYYYRIFCSSAPPTYREQQLQACEQVARLSGQTMKKGD
jgi:tetratricopeptide (TPR) repeat protein